MRAALEVLGLVLVVTGLALASLPLGLVAAGLSLIFAAHSPEPVPAEEPLRRAA